MFPLLTSSNYVLQTWKDGAGKRLNTVEKKFCIESKIKLIIYLSKAVPFRKLFSQVVSKKVSKKHFW